MPENDLKLLCDAIPVSNAGDVSTQAHSILLGLTGDNVDFNIGGGQQPSLFKPKCYQSNLQLVGVNNQNNGAFEVTLQYYVDNQLRNGGVLTADDEGKDAYVTASCTDFQSTESDHITIHFPTGRPGVFMDVTPQPCYTLNQGYYLIAQLSGFSNQIFAYFNNLVGAAYIQYSIDGGTTWKYFCYFNGNTNYYTGAPYIILNASIDDHFTLNGNILIKCGGKGTAGDLVIRVPYRNIFKTTYIKGVLKTDVPLNEWRAFQSFTHISNIADAIVTECFDSYTDKFDGTNSWFWPVRGSANATVDTLKVSVANITRGIDADSKTQSLGDWQFSFTFDHYEVGDQFQILFQAND